jgi:hypothetical protein
MRAVLKRSLLAATTALGFGLLASAPAQAQFSPCQVLMPGYVAPPPCITFDYKRLADMATKQAQEAQKVASKVEEIKSWTSGQQIIGKMKEAVGIGSLTGTQVFNGLPQSFPGVTSTTSFLTAKASTSSLFADAGAGNSVTGGIQGMRDQYSRNAKVDALALAYRKDAMLSKSLDDANRIAQAAASSPDLRTDWAVNSQAKVALARARTTQNYLWQAYLQRHATGQIAVLPVDIGTKEMAPSASSSGTAAVADNGDWARLQQLVALNSEAQNLLNLLGASKSADQVTGMIDQVKADYQDALSRQANLVAQFPVNAQQWACNADHCGSASIIVSTSLASLSAWDGQMSSLRSEDISQLGAQFSQRGIDVAQMTSSDIDPRQFIGTWGDPSKYDMITAIGNNLTSGALDKYIKGDGDNAAFRQFLYDYNDVRLEVAWKKEAYDQALAAQQQVADTKASIQQDATTNLSEDDVTARLKEIASEGNSLGQQLATSQDANIVSTAKQRLDDLQATLNQGVKLPEPASFDPSICDQASQYSATQGVTMTSDELAYCKQQGNVSR